MQAAVHYIIAVALLAIYGGQVCPFLESLTLATLTLVIASFALLFFGIRVPLLKSLVLSTELNARARRHFLTEMAVFITLGASLTLFNMVFYDFPFASGIKLFIGCLTLGFFASADLALHCDYEVGREIDRAPDLCILPHGFFSLTKKMIIVTIILAALTSLVQILVVLHDLNWIRQLPEEADLSLASRGIIMEFSFVLLVLLLYTSRLIYSYTRNLKLYFNRQTGVLEGVSRGRLDGHVPVTTNDEFGVIARYTNQMIEGLRQRTEELQLTQDVTILSLASLAETRDNETGQHILRTQRYVRCLAEKLQDHSRFRPALNSKVIDLLYKSAPLHDIGKVGIPDHILLKPGKLTDEEFEIMKKHAVYGSEALLTAIERLGDNSFLEYAREIAHTHHEKWDGSGYPQGTKGDDIPLSGRLMALADVYDALISKRVYKPAFPHEKAFAIIQEGRGSHFDPDMVDAFVAVEQQFKEIANQFSDNA